MLGTSNLSFRTGGYIIPIETIDATNKIITVNVPSGCRILCTNCTLEDQSTLISDGSVSLITNGFVINKDIDNLKIILPISELAPITILCGREILYSSNGVKKITLESPDTGISSAVIYKDQIHALMGGSNYNAHYKWNGTEWVSVSTLPYKCNNSRAIVYNDEIHIFGGAETGTGNYHYKWNGTEWASVSTLPINVTYGGVVVYNDEIHIITDSSDDTTVHYKWDGTTWTSVSTLPYQLFQGKPFVYNDEIHVFGAYRSAYSTNHYKWNGTEWVSVSTLPSGMGMWLPVIYDNKLHLLSSTNLYAFDGTTWTNISTVPYKLSNSAFCVYDNNIHIISGSSSTISANYYIWDGESWKDYMLQNAFNLPKGSRVNGILCETTGENIIPEKNNYIIEL